MDPQIYAEMIEQETTHWWFRSRRAIVGSLLSTLRLPEDAQILDAGCGSGGNLFLLSQLGQVYAFEMNDRARAYAQSRKVGNVEAGMLPSIIPFPDTQFDVIGLFDVMEHVEDDVAALNALAARLKPGGVMCITIPAYQWLFVRHDKLHHHFRRYSRKQLLEVLERAGLKTEFTSYWNFLLFPVAMVVRLIDMFGIPKNHTIGARKPSGFVNEMLYRLVSSERLLIPKPGLPFGLSIIALARKL